MPFVFSENGKNFLDIERLVWLGVVFKVASG